MANRILAAACLTLGLATASVAEPGGKVAPSGGELFAEHCATCHGSEGIGNGPMASVLTVRPADLTMITARSKGSFPAARVVEVIRYGGNVPGPRVTQQCLSGDAYLATKADAEGLEAFTRGKPSLN